MIGQRLLKLKFQEQIQNNTLPHFIILAGAVGSGKKTLLADIFKDAIYLENNKIDSVRKMIELVHKVDSKMFIMTDVDTMSIGGKNALLKIIEECPNNNYFIMTVQDPANVSNTIRSRAQLYRMTVYTPDEIKQYISTKITPVTDFDLEKISFIERIAETPGDVNALLSYDVLEFESFAKAVLNSIEKASGANAFKIADRLSIKDGDGKWDIALFLRVFNHLCLDHSCQDLEDREHLIKYSRGCIITSKYIQQLRLSGINKQFLIDSWILEIRRAWM